jgi:hypothetical protein
MPDHGRTPSGTSASTSISRPSAAIRGQIGKGGDQIMPVFLSKDALDKQGP